MQVFDLQSIDFDEAYLNGVSNGNVDVAFRKIAKNCTAFLIWRVENMSLVAVPRDQYGTFYQCDSYVVYASSLPAQPVGVETVSREVKGAALEYHIHFWLGSATSPGKSGVAAYKTVELDSFLGATSVQHRETEGNESARFKSYFKNGIKISVVESEGLALPRLFKVRGKCTPVVTQAESVSWQEFNSSEIFILQTQRALLVWIGRAADAAERLSAAKLANEMKEQFQIATISFVDDGYEKTLDESAKNEWNKYLPLDKRQVLPENHTNCGVSNKRSSSIRLYNCTESAGKYRVTEVKCGPLFQTDLNPSDVFIIDQETSGIWIWAGKRASERERSEALRNARGFVKKKKYPNNTRVTRIVDGSEPYEFKMLFSYWKATESKNNTILVSKFDALTMEERPTLAAETQLIDDGTGNITLWRVKQQSIVEIPRERHGFFFSADCYIVLYNYETATDEKHLLYYWMGSHASQDEIGTISAKIEEIGADLALGFKARVFQGREPAHFMQIFRGKLIVFKGKGTDFDESGRNLKHPLQYFLQISGSTLASSRAVQVQPRASQLNSNYCFVLKRGKHAFIWCGNYSTGDQREMAKLFAGKDFELVLEGKEKAGFFDLLGGKTAYPNQIVRNDGDARPARLFYCFNNHSLQMELEEIVFFNQSDLLPENVMLLDYHTVIYLWIGKLSSKDDQKRGIQLALNYLQTDPCGRDLNTTVIELKQGCEPPTFKGFFPLWDDTLWKRYKSFGKLRQDMEQKYTNSNGASENNNGVYQKSGHSDFDQYDKYPVDILKEPNDKLPVRVDPLHKELHLTHDDFVAILKMSYVDFDKLPRWKQQELKKKNGLF